MTIPAVPVVPEVFAPLVDMLGDQLLTTTEVAEHFRFSPDHLANLRRVGKFLPWIQLPTGAVRYRLADVAAVQLAGMSGPLTVEKICLALAACRDLDPAAKAAAQAAIMRAFPDK